MITSLKQLDFSKKYTYSDYLLWKFQERVELLKGKLLPMAAPNVVHQKISSNFHGILWTFLNKKPCHLFSAPFDVRLPIPTPKSKDGKISTVVQPDLCVICDDNKLDKQGCIGAPDLVVEILSPGNSKREMRDKFNLYQEAGVLEYWVVDAEHRIVFTYTLDKKSQKFTAQLPVLTDEDVLKSIIFENLEIQLADIFPIDPA